MIGAVFLYLRLVFLWIQVENSYDVCDCASIFVHSQNQKALNLVVGTRTYVSFIVVVVSMYSRIIYLLFIKKSLKNGNDF